VKMPAVGPRRQTTSVISGTDLESTAYAVDTAQNTS